MTPLTRWSWPGLVLLAVVCGLALLAWALVDPAGLTRIAHELSEPLNPFWPPIWLGH